MTKILRIILAAIALIILANAAYLWLAASFNVGLLLTTVLGASLFFYALLPTLINRLLHNRFGRILKGLLLLTIAFFVFTSTLITVSGRTDTVTYQEDAVIILGAGIRGDQVSRVLAYRLDAALQYHQMNPEAFLVVSGGQGDGETITEAEAMTRYLLARGVPPEKIIREERATSTLENFLYAKELLEERFSAPYQTAYITNHFHIFRAGRVAKSAGLRATRLHAQNDLLTLLPDYLRECCALAYYWLRG